MAILLAFPQCVPALSHGWLAMPWQAGVSVLVWNKECEVCNYML